MCLFILNYRSCACPKLVLESPSNHFEMGCRLGREWLFVCVNICIYIYIYMYTYIYIYICMCTYMYIYIYMCIYIYIYILILIIIIIIMIFLCCVLSFVRERASLVTYEQGPTEKSQSGKRMASGIPSRVRVRLKRIV